MSITATCLEIRDQMDRTWQRLPVSRQLPEPLPLAVLVDIRAGRRVAQQRTFSAVMAATDELLARPPLPMLLEAAPGGGKTSALKWIARTLADRISDGDETLPLPVYIDLGQVGSASSIHNLTELCALQLARRRPINYQSFAASDRPKLFLLDGLDLLSTIRPTELLDAALNSDPDQFLFSTRVHHSTRSALDEWPTSYRIQLASLQREAREAWLTAVVPPPAKFRFDAIFAHNPQVDSLLGVPLLFAMTASACLDDDAEFRVDAFPGRTGIFAGFVAYAVRRAEREGRITPGEVNAWESAWPLWHAFCFEAATDSYLDRIPETEVQRLVDLAYAKMPSREPQPRTQWPTALRVALAAGIVTRENDALVFLHQQFAEYFAGRHLATMLTAAAPDGSFYDHFRETLERPELDPISAHALSVLAARPATYALVEDTTAWLRSFDLADACDLLSQTGSSLACSLLQLVVEDRSLEALDRLLAIEALARVPHPHAIPTLMFAATHVGEGEFDLAQTAILALGTIATAEARQALGAIAANSTADTRVRLAAYLRGGEWSPTAAQALARQALESTDTELTQLASNALGCIGDVTDIERLRGAGMTDQASYVQKRLDSDEPNRLPPPVRLETYEEYLKYARYQRALGSAITKNSILDIRESAIASGKFKAGSPPNRPDFLAREDEDLLPTLLALTDPAEPRKDLFHTKLVNLCGMSHRFTELLAHPLSRRLPTQIIVDCAKASGRRHLVPPKAASVKPDEPATFKKLSAEVVVAQYLTEIVSKGGRLSLRSAAHYSETIGHRWSPETIRNTKIWQTNQARLADFKAAHTRDRRRRARKRSSD